MSCQLCFRTPVPPSCRVDLSVPSTGILGTPECSDRPMCHPCDAAWCHLQWNHNRFGGPLQGYPFAVKLVHAWASLHDIPRLLVGGASPKKLLVTPQWGAQNRLIELPGMVQERIFEAFSVDLDSPVGSPENQDHGAVAPWSVTSHKDAEK